MIEGRVIGAESVIAGLGMASEESRKRVRSAVQRLGLELLRKIKEDFLSGRALGVRTGRLRRSINESTSESGTEITSSVGTVVGYGRVWELGFTGSQAVKSFSRTGRTGVVQQVKAFSRKVNIVARPFLRPALAEMAPRVRTKLAEVLRGL